MEDRQCLRRQLSQAQRQLAAKDAELETTRSTLRIENKAKCEAEAAVCKSELKEAREWVDEAEKREANDHRAVKAVIDKMGIVLRNASNDACDMVSGPCCCGATHTLAETVERALQGERAAREKAEAAFAFVISDADSCIAQLETGHSMTAPTIAALIQKLVHPLANPGSALLARMKEMEEVIVDYLELHVSEVSDIPCHCRMCDRARSLLNKGKA